MQLKSTLVNLRGYLQDELQSEQHHVDGWLPQVNRALARMKIPKSKECLRRDWNRLD